ncbi:MAG: HIT family protein [Anaerolineae bacterium]
MKRIWAPWRMRYLKGEHRAVEGCVFCHKITADDAEEHVLYRGKHCFVVLNRFPYSNGHLMIVPYAHVSSIQDLEAPVLLEMVQLLQEAQRILGEVQAPDGYNVGINEGSAAGAGIEEHIHMHIVPRWEGDANYMTVIGDTRVIPQSLDDTYAMLRPHFDRISR